MDDFAISASRRSIIWRRAVIVCIASRARLALNVLTSPSAQVSQLETLPMKALTSLSMFGSSSRAHSIGRISSWSPIWARGGLKLYC